MTLLLATHGHPPVVAVFAASLAGGKGRAELQLYDAWRLARRLDELLTKAGYEGPADQ